MRLFHKKEEKNSKGIEMIRTLKRNLSGREFHELLGQTKSEAGIRSLVDSLEDDELRWSAALALGKIRSKKVARALIELFTAPRKGVDVYRSIAWILGEIGHEEAIPVLTEALENLSKDVEIRRNAAQSLGKIGSVEAAESLVEALRDEGVRQNAAQALGKIKSAYLVEYLHAYLWNKDPGMRQGITWALREIASEKSIEPLAKALEDEEEKVRDGATWALKRIFSPKNEDKMLEILTTREEEEIRERAAKILFRIGGPEVRRQLKELSPKLPPENGQEEITTIEVDKELKGG